MIIVINACCNTTSRCILIAFEWYGRPKKDAKKSSSNTFFIHISRKHGMKYGLQILKNKIIFKGHKYPSSYTLSIKYLLTLSYNHWKFLGIIKLFHPYFKKAVCTKNIWMQHSIVVSTVRSTVFLNQ